MTYVGVEMHNANLPERISLLEEELLGYLRNLYPMDPVIPRARWPEEVLALLRLEQLPQQYSASEVWRRAHRVSQQLSVLRFDSRVP